MEVAKWRGSVAAVAVVLALGLIVLAAPAAEANYLSTKWGFTYTSVQQCAKNYDELSHSSTYPGGTYQSAVEMWMNSTYPFVGGFSCHVVRSTLLKARVRAWVWTASGTPTVKPGGGSWAVCKDYGPFQVGSIVDRYVVGLKYGTAPCGSNRYYTSDGWGQVHWNSAWWGGWRNLWTTSSQWYHKLPAS